jgi:hypothetical protein
MSELTTLRYQKKHKPKIEEVIPHIVAEGQQDAALAFVAWMRGNKMAPGSTGIHNQWDAKCRGSNICKLSLGGGNWRIRLYNRFMNENEQAVTSAGLDGFVWDNLIGKCACGWHEKGCPGGQDRSLFGKTYGNKCRFEHWPMSLTDPDKTEIEAVKKLLLLERDARLAVPAHPDIETRSRASLKGKAWREVRGFYNFLKDNGMKIRYTGQEYVYRVSNSGGLVCDITLSVSDGLRVDFCEIDGDSPSFTNPNAAAYERMRELVVAKKI